MNLALEDFMISLTEVLATAAKVNPNKVLALSSSGGKMTMTDLYEGVRDRTTLGYSFGEAYYAVHKNTGVALSTLVSLEKENLVDSDEDMSDLSAL